MNKIYIKVINLVKYDYEFVARYLPALIFTVIVEVCILYHNRIAFDLGMFDIVKIPLLILVSLIVAVIPKIISTNITGYLQTLYWNKYGNPIVKYINKANNLEYKKLLDKYDTNDALITDLLKETRNDKKLLSKNIFYGFCRNFSFLVLLFLIINLMYFRCFVAVNIGLIIFSLLMVYLSSQRYAEQIIKSYIERTI